MRNGIHVRTYTYRYKDVRIQTGMQKINKHKIQNDA